MARKTVLRGSSALVMPDGKILEVSDETGKMVIDPAIWADYKQTVAKRISKQLSQHLSQHPEDAPKFGLQPGESGTVTLQDLMHYLKGDDA